MMTCFKIEPVVDFTLMLGLGYVKDLVLNADFQGKYVFYRYLIIGEPKLYTEFLTL